MKALIVSAALDTNGQNARYAKAADRWGDNEDVLRALIVGEYDPANVGNRYAQAAKKVDGLSIRAAHVAEAYFGFPRDIRWNRQTHADVRQLAEECDIVHLNNSPAAYDRLQLARFHKPALLHHHGTLFRNNPAPLLDVAKRRHMVQAVSTVDLKRIAPELLHWLPTAYDLDELAEIGQANRRAPDGLVRIVSAPTNREIKSTAALQAAVTQLQREGLPVELVLVERKTWTECLRLKATADVYFDQVGLGYGCNAIEAWGMGIPVIAGADEWTLAEMRKEWNGTLPFYTATEATIADALRAMVQSPDLRAEWAGIGMAHVQRYHGEKPALVRLAELYGMAIAKGKAAPTAAYGDRYEVPGTFRSANENWSLRVGSMTVHFVDGIAKVDDPKIASKLRRIAAARPKFKITEEAA